MALAANLPQAGAARTSRDYTTLLWCLFFFIVFVIFASRATSGSYSDQGIFFWGYSAVIAAYVFSRFLFSYLHKAIVIDPDYEPTISFVVPTKNEEDNITETFLRFAEVDYPKEKIEVIAIDDGSTDNTYAEMERASALIAPHVKRVELVKWEVNKGKRYGMAEGSLRATHDIIIFIDSDSFVEPGAVRHLVKYFSTPQIGAVSAHTDVWNTDTNTLTQMQALRYFVSFKIYKAAESIFGIVTCCPGCCSAYRRIYLLEIIEPWLHQTFLGVECTFGDDRSLTNYMLRSYLAVYSPEAKAYTVVPDTFRKYQRQQQRWKKSWVRESLIAASFIWRKHPISSAFFYSYIFLAFAGPIVFIHAVIWNPIMRGMLPWVYFLGLFLMLAIHGIYYRIHVGKKPWLFATLTFWFYTVILMWQLPWALVTIADTRWGTR
jgi:hyaluronan synthase